MTCLKSLIEIYLFDSSDIDGSSECILKLKESTFKLIIIFSSNISDLISGKRCHLKLNN